MLGAQDRNAIAALNRELFSLLATFPQARRELIDFHVKHAVESYIDAIREFPGRKTVQLVKSEGDVRAAIRRSMVAADLVCFSVDEYVGPSGFGLVPLSDDLESPILGALAVRNVDTGCAEYTRAMDWLMMMGYRQLQGIQEAKSSAATQLLGTEWSGDGQLRWQRTIFGRLADAVSIIGGQPASYAGGFFHTSIPQASTLFDDCKSLMQAGRLVFTPFYCLSPPSLSQGEGVLKAGILNATHLTSSTFGADSGNESLLLDLEIPYIEDIPLPLLAKILDDEGESLVAFRTKLDRAIEDIAAKEDPHERFKQALALRRGVLEDELERVRHTCARIARMNSIARTGAYVAATGLSVAAVYGLAIPSVIAGCSAPLFAAIKALWDNYEAKHELRRSPAYFVWRLAAKVKR